MDTVLSFIKDNRSLPALIDLPETLFTLMLTPRFEASRHVIFLVMPLGKTQPILVAKIPRVLHLGDHLDHEASVLQKIQNLRPGGFRSIPQVITFQNYRGYPILLETALNGPLMSPDLVRSNPARMMKITIDWLYDLQANPTELHDDCWYTELVESSLAVLRNDFPLTEMETNLLNRTEEHLAILKNMSLPYVLQHGDLSHPNIVLTSQDSIGVLDWELARVRGLVSSDFFLFLSYVVFSLSRANENGEYVSAFDKAFFGDKAWMQPHIRTYVAACRLQQDAVPGLFLLCWLRYLVQFIGRLHIYKTEPISIETANVVRNNRYYAIWKHTVEQFKNLSI